MSTFDDFMISQQVESNKDVDRLREDVRIYKQAFEASLRWADCTYKEDFESTTSLHGRGFDDSYLMDVGDIRRAIRRSEER